MKFMMMDIYALVHGSTINDAGLDRLSCSIVAGANNQLENGKRGEELKTKIIYAPDYD